MRARCWTCGARLILALIDNEPDDRVVVNHSCPRCGARVPLTK